MKFFLLILIIYNNLNFYNFIIIISIFDAHTKPSLKKNHNLPSNIFMRKLTICLDCNKG